MTAGLNTLRVRSRQQWRAWLTRHHTSSPGVWLVFYKAHTGVTSIAYEDTVREALCFGPLCASVREFCTRCVPHSGPRRAERARKYWKPAKSSVGISRAELLVGSWPA